MTKTRLKDFFVPFLFVAGFKTNCECLVYSILRQWLIEKKHAFKQSLFTFLTCTIHVENKLIHKVLRFQKMLLKKKHSSLLQTIRKSPQMLVFDSRFLPLHLCSRWIQYSDELKRGMLTMNVMSLEISHGNMPFNCWMKYP